MMFFASLLFIALCIAANALALAENGLTPLTSLNFVALIVAVFAGAYIVELYIRKDSR